MINTIKNLSLIYCVNFISGMLGFLIIPIGIHRLGIEGFGLFSLFLILTTYFDLLDLGLTKNLCRLIANNNDLDFKIKQFQITLGILLITVAFIILNIPLIIYFITHYAFPLPLKSQSILKFMIIFAILEYIFSLPVKLLKANLIGLEHFKLYSSYSILSATVKYLFINFGLLISDKPHVIAFFIVIYRLGELVISYFYLGNLPKDSWKPKLSLTATYTTLKESIALSGVQLVQLLFLSTGTYLANRYFGLSGLGIYQAAYNIANKIWFFSNSIGLIIYPRFVKLVNSHHAINHVEQKLMTIINTSWSIYCFIAALTILLSPYGLTLLKINTPITQDLLMLLLLALCVNAHSDIAYNYLQAKRYYKEIVIITMIACVFMVIFIMLFKESLGILSLGGGWIIGQMTYALLSDTLITQLKYRYLLQNLLLKFTVLSLSLIVCIEKINNQWVMPWLITGLLLVISIFNLFQIRFNQDLSCK